MRLNLQINQLAKYSFQILSECFLRNLPDSYKHDFICNQLRCQLEFSIPDTHLLTRQFRFAHSLKILNIISGKYFLILHLSPDSDHASIFFINTVSFDLIRSIRNIGKFQFQLQFISVFKIFPKMFFLQLIFLCEEIVVSKCLLIVTDNSIRIMLVC